MRSSKSSLIAAAMIGLLGAGAAGRTLAVDAAPRITQQASKRQIMRMARGPMPYGDRRTGNHTVAQDKRAALKARNRARNKRRA